MFSGHIDTTIDIAAPPKRVWAVLTELGERSWDPFLLKLEAPEGLEAGRVAAITAKPQGQSPATFKPKLLTVAPGRELRWRGSLGLGLFTGEHYFELVAAEGGAATRLRHGENFTGLLVPLLRGMLRATEEGFGAMNQAVKARAEGGAPAAAAGGGS